MYLHVGGDTFDMYVREIALPDMIVLHVPAEHDASTPEAAAGRVERGEQGDGRPGNGAPRGGSLRELAR